MAAAKGWAAVTEQIMTGDQSDGDTSKAVAKCLVKLLLVITWKAGNATPEGKNWEAVLMVCVDYSWLYLTCNTEKDELRNS